MDMIFGPTTPDPDWLGRLWRSVLPRSLPRAMALAARQHGRIPLRFDLPEDTDLAWVPENSMWGPAAGLRAVAWIANRTLVLGVIYRDLHDSCEVHWL